MKQLKIYMQGLMTALILVLTLASCIKDTLDMAECGNSADKDMYLKVNVPRTYANTSGGGADKETLIGGIDVLVFAPGAGSDAGKFFLKSASEGTPVESGNKFQVTMPVGENLAVHVFANCHDMMVAKGAYKEVGMEMDALLQKLYTAIDHNAVDTDRLPMHGFCSGVVISKESAGTVLTVPVLRSVAAVQVTTKATVNPDGTLTPGQITDPTGQVIFSLREFYAYFSTKNGCVAPSSDAYEPASTEDLEKETRNVEKVSLPKEADVYPLEKKYSIISATAVGQLGSLYLYENKHYTDNGYDQPGTVAGNDKVATTRLVVGGVYADDKDADGNPKVTYYRVDIANVTTQKLTDLLRNHKYTFNITDVAGCGYDTPDEAATGVPINITIQVIDWTDVNNNVDFDHENWFSAETKDIALPRNAHSVRSINVETDVAFGSFWTLSFNTDNNGTVAPVQIADGATIATIENDRYKIELNRTAESPNTKVTLGVTAKLPYSSAPAAPASRDEVLVIKAKNLRIYIHITQVDKSPDDWGNGGDLNTDIGEDPNKPIDVGLGFVVAKGNMVATKQADGSYTYAFAEEQGYYSGIVAGDDYFCWNTLDPSENNTTQSSWEDSRDVCRKIGDGNWYTPSKDQFIALDNAGSVLGTYKMNGNEINGCYFGTNSTPDEADQDKYVFLPAAGSRSNLGSNNGYYWSSTPTSSSSLAYRLHFDSGSIAPESTSYRRLGFSVRCVRDK